MIYLSYGSAPLPSRDEAMAAPLRAFRSWYLRIECERWERYAAETHMTIAGLGDQIIGDLLAKMHHDGCGGRPQFAELITGIPAPHGPCAGSC
jgi:hypothetical protein